LWQSTLGNLVEHFKIKGNTLLLLMIEIISRISISQEIVADGSIKGNTQRFVEDLWDCSL
jgi:hypothetical protein